MSEFVDDIKAHLQTKDDIRLAQTGCQLQQCLMSISLIDPFSSMMASSCVRLFIDC